jgi:HNH endonuclease
VTVGRVEWVLIVRYGSAAHRATYGRLPGTLYSKDFIQLSRKPAFIDELEAILPDLNTKPKAPIIYKWPGGTASGTLVKVSADRPHLSWVTSEGAPAPWRMAKKPSEVTAETIPGNPDHKDQKTADLELEHLLASGFGQPFLVAVKIRGEDRTLHLRVHVEAPNAEFEWANIKATPSEIKELADSTRPSSVLASRLFKDGYELYFDTSAKANPWRDSAGSSKGVLGGKQLTAIGGSVSQASQQDSDSIAESLEGSEEEISKLAQQIARGDFSVPDSTATVKTRGSAQRVFAQRVKQNYEWRCALTGITTHNFLIASHIVPWSVDESIRLDPSNGICLSVFIDRAFEHGFLLIDDDLSVRVNYQIVGDDEKLTTLLASFEGAKLQAPKECPPKVEYLSRRRSIVGAS